MTYGSQRVLQIRSQAPAETLPPVTIEESPWDILLALYSDRRCDLSLTKLGSLVSVRRSALNRWLSMLEDRGFVARVRYGFSGERRAILTVPGRQLLDRYLTASSDLRVGTRH